MKGRSKHIDLLIPSVINYVEVYKRNGGQVNSDLKILVIIDTLLNLDGDIFTDKEKLELKAIYDNLRYDDRVITYEDISSPLYINSSFKEITDANEDTPTSVLVKYHQAPVSKSIVSIMREFEAGYDGDSYREISLQEAYDGHKYIAPSAGRLAIQFNSEVNNLQIYDELENNITKEFTFSRERGRQIFISNNIIAGANLFLKFK